MRRIVLVVSVLGGMLLATSGAQAKAPPDGVDVCGATGACNHLSWQDAESLPNLWASSSEGFTTPAAASPFYLVRWHWPDRPENTRYYVPSGARVWYADEKGVGQWRDLSSGNVAALQGASATLDPFPVPTVLRVTVGGRAARDPQSYLDLFGRGSPVWFWLNVRWLRVKIVADSASPWTSPATDVRISRRGGYLRVGSTVLKIPLQLARRTRSRVSLRG